MQVERRRLLGTGSAALLASLMLPLAEPAFAGAAFHGARRLASAPRVLSFDNDHTRERLTVAYWADGGYIEDALNAINHVLRDFRNNEVHVIEPKLLDLLVLLHRTVENRNPFQVISGYRSPATNRMLRAETSGVAAKSLHMQGMAIDIRLAGCELDRLHAAAQSLRLGGVGYYPKKDFIHVDVGPVRYW